MDVARPSTGLPSLEASLRRAAVRASVAHSVRDAQPWRLEAGRDVLHVLSDTTQWHPAVDPAGRQLTLSVGCALFNARASLHADRVPHVVRRFPDAHRPEVVATLVPSHDVSPYDDPDRGLGLLAEVADGRRQSAAELDRALTEGQAAALMEAVSAEDVELTVLTDPELCALLLARCERPEDQHGAGVLAVLSTSGDRALDWLRAGEALQRLLLTASLQRLGAAGVDELVGSPDLRGLVRHEAVLSGHPQAVVRLGAPGREIRGRRRRLADVLVTGAGIVMSS